MWYPPPRAHHCTISTAVTFAPSHLVPYPITDTLLLWSLCLISSTRHPLSAGAVAERIKEQVKEETMYLRSVSQVGGTGWAVQAAVQMDGEGWAQYGAFKILPSPSPRTMHT